MKRHLCLLWLLLFCTLAYPNSPVTLSPAQIEHLFLEHNLELIAGQLNIAKADAAIAQARLWENPNLSINEVSFWSSRSQREGESEIIPPLFGTFGKNTQFSVELSQLIQTAGKRKKLIQRESVSRDLSLLEFEELLRSLKIELRTSVIEIQYLQEYRQVLQLGQKSVSRLIEAYSRQVEKGNISVHELLRLQTALFEIDNELNALQIEWNALHKNLKIWLNAEAGTTILVDSAWTWVKPLEDLSLSLLMETAYLSRPDLKATYSQIRYHEKSVEYEKAQRVPDLNVSANYDRAGGVWKDFVGLGLGIDLPVFNRNQGNLKAARIEKEQSQYQALQQQQIVNNEVVEAYENYVLSYSFYEKIQCNPLFIQLDEMLDVYTRNLINRNISMLEYIDFIESFKTTKQHLLNARKNLNIQFEELQFTIGTDLK